MTNNFDTKSKNAIPIETHECLFGWGSSKFYPTNVL